MKRVISVLIIVLLICSFVFIFNKGKYQPVISSNISNRSTIVIDAGHGGVDAGAIAIDNTPEKGINLSIALSLYDYLMVSGIDSQLIRDGDYEIYPNGIDRSRSDLYNRMDIINSVHNSMLVSIHQNHFENENEWGTQIWYSDNNQISKKVADRILNNIKYFLQPDNKRKNKASDDSYYLLYKAKVPSVMVECGFISNREENKKLQNKEYQNDLAYSILLGVNEAIYG